MLSKLVGLIKTIRITNFSNFKKLFQTGLTHEGSLLAMCPYTASFCNKIKKLLDRDEFIDYQLRIKELNNKIKLKKIIKIIKLSNNRCNSQ